MNLNALGLAGFVVLAGAVGFKLPDYLQLGDGNKQVAVAEASATATGVSSDACKPDRHDRFFSDQRVAECETFVARTDLPKRTKAEALYYLGYAYTNHGPAGSTDFKATMRRAIQTWEGAIAADPSFEDAYLAKGYYLTLTGSALDAVAVYDIAIGLVPSDWRAFAGKAQALSATGDNDKALAESEKAIALAPDNKRAIQVHAHMLAHLNRYAEASEAYLKALRPYDPSRPEQLGLYQEPNPWAEAARTLNLAGRPAKAVAILTEYLGKTPKQFWEAMMLDNRATYEEAAGQFKEAAADLDQAMRMPDAINRDAMAARRSLLLIKAGTASGETDDIEKRIEHGNLQQILIVQVFLKNSGYANIEINGKFDAPTKGALQKCISDPHCSSRLGQPI